MAAAATRLAGQGGAGDEDQKGCADRSVQGAHVTDSIWEPV